LAWAKQEAKERHAAASWPPDIGDDVKLATVEAWQNAMSSKTVAETTCLVCGELSKTAQEHLAEELLAKLPAFRRLLVPNPAMPSYVQTVLPLLRYTWRKASTNELIEIDAFNGLLLCQQGIFTADDDDSPGVRVCRSCFNDIKAQRLPAVSVANDNWHGPIPECIASLTFPERQLIQPHRVLIWLVQMRSSMNLSIAAYKGVTTAHPQDHVAVYHSLPLPLTDLKQCLAVQFVGPRPTARQLRKPWSINRFKVPLRTLLLLPTVSDIAGRACR